MDSEKVLRNYKLLLSIIKQLNVTGRTINWELVAKDLELEKGGTANKRWSRFKKAHSVEFSLPGETHGGSGASKGVKGKKVGKDEKGTAGKVKTEDGDEEMEGLLEYDEDGEMIMSDDEA